LNLSAKSIIEFIDGDDETGNINFNNLRGYLNGCGVLPYDSEIISLLRRVDRDDDGVLILTEFDNFL
jgi:Ca2+-binding EF-hand superfamily protein